jgi:predicted component of type VI protein secretion system
MNPADSWPAVGAIFNAGSNVNNLNRSAKSSNNGSTFNGGGSSSSPFSIVIDLGQTRTFNRANYYQMFSDGKTTHAALDISATGSLQTRTGSWTQVHSFVLLDNSDTSQGVVATFSSTTARYIRVRIYNDGRYGDTSYTELYNIKLYNV